MHMNITYITLLCTRYPDESFKKTAVLFDNYTVEVKMD